MARARLSPVGHDLGLALTVALTLLFEAILCWVLARTHGVAADGRVWLTLALVASPLLLAMIAIAVSLAARPARVRWAVAALFLLVPPALFATGAFHG